MLYYWYLVWILVTAIIYIALVKFLPPGYRRSELSNFLGNEREVTHTNALLVAFVSAIALVISLAASGMEFTEAKEGFEDNNQEEKAEKAEKEKKEREAKEKKEREAAALKEKEAKLQKLRDSQKAASKGSK